MKTQKMKTSVRIDGVMNGKKRHFRSTTLNIKPDRVWRALSHGLAALNHIDLAKLRAKNKRNGGTR